ncbi:hypothetical protein QFZ97_000983 [Paraburkholderia youngii]
MRDQSRRETRVGRRARLRKQCRRKVAVRVVKIAKSTLAREARRMMNGAVNLALNRVKRPVPSAAVGLVASHVALR